MKKKESAWDERVAKERPIARSQPKFPWQVKPAVVEDRKDQEDQSTPQTGAFSVPVTGTEKAPVTKNVTGAEKVTVTEKAPVATFRIPHQELDYLFLALDPGEFKLYLRLFRLSHGWGKETCSVGDSNLVETLNMSKNALRAAKRGLISKQLIEITQTVNRGPNGFTEYYVFRTGEKTKGNWYRKGTSAVNVTGTEKDPIKEDHDHDDLKRNHHQKETMMIYQKLTGNKWKKADDEAYDKIKNISLENIEQGIRLAIQRAASRPNSLNYFVKEIMNLAQPSERSRTQRKKSLEKIVARVRERNVGAANGTLADFVEDVKREAARESVAFDNDLFNQIIGT